MAKQTKPTTNECGDAAKTTKQLVAYLRKAHPSFAISSEKIYCLDRAADMLFAFADYFAVYPKED